MTVYLPIEFDINIATSLTRIKLKETELQLLRERLKQCDRIIISSIKQFTTENNQTFEEHKEKVHIYVGRMEKENYSAYKEKQHQITNNNSLIMNNCIKFVEKHIQSHVLQIQSYIPIENITNEQYVQAAEQSWKTHKTHIIAQYFRTYVSAYVNMFAQNAANEFFCERFFDIQKLYTQYLQAVIMKNLIQEMIANPMLQYDPFPMQQSTEEKLAESRIASTQKTYVICKRKFQKSLLSLHYEVDNYTEPQKNIGQCANVPVAINNNSQQYSPMKFEINPIPYNNQHQSNYNVKACRYNPLGQGKY